MIDLSAIRARWGAVSPGVRANVYGHSQAVRRLLEEDLPAAIAEIEALRKRLQERAEKSIDAEFVVI